MFSLEFTSGRPLGSAPYYSIVVREPYLVGRARGADIFLDHSDIVRQHASLTVMRQSEAEDHKREQMRLRQRDHSEDLSDDPIDETHTNDSSFLHTNAVNHNGRHCSDSGEGENHVDAFSSQHPPSIPEVLHESDPLIVRIVNLREGGTITADNQDIGDGPAYLSDGAHISFGTHVSLRLRYRPLVVSISRSAFSVEYVRELEFMYNRLGATLTSAIGPTPRLEVPQPIGLLHCAESVDDDPWCLVALACGYSVVHPNYVFEWFAALAQSPTSPLSVLPAPVRFEVPIQSHGAYAHAGFYLRPESDICPFPLYRIPSTATLKRARDTLFEGRKFIFFTNTVEQRYRTVVLLCGGVIHHSEDVLSITSNYRANKAQEAPVSCKGAETLEAKDSSQDPDLYTKNQRNGHAHLQDTEDGAKPSDLGTQTLPNLYAVVDLDMEAAMERQDLRGQSAVRQVVEDAHCAGLRIPFISERNLFHALLTNRFSVCEIPCLPDTLLPQQVHQQQSQEPEQNLKPYCKNAGNSMGNGYDALNVVEVDHHSYHTSQAELLPIHSSSRMAVSSTCAASHDGYRSIRRERPSLAVSPSKSRRIRHNGDKGYGFRTGSPSVPPPVTINEAYDSLRHRVRAFAAKAAPMLHNHLASARRNCFVDSSAATQAAEWQSQAARLATKAEILCAHANVSERLTTALHRLAKECRHVGSLAHDLLVQSPHPTRRGPFPHTNSPPTARRGSPLQSARPSPASHLSPFTPRAMESPCARSQIRSHPRHVRTPMRHVSPVAQNTLSPRTLWPRPRAQEISCARAPPEAMGRTGETARGPQRRPEATAASPETVRPRTAAPPRRPSLTATPPGRPAPRSPAATPRTPRRHSPRVAPPPVSPPASARRRLIQL